MVAAAAVAGRAWGAAQAADAGRLDSLRATLAARASDTTAPAPFGDPRSRIGRRPAPPWMEVVTNHSCGANGRS